MQDPFFSFPEGSSAFATQSRTSRRRSNSITTFLEDDEDIRGGRFSSLIGSFSGGRLLSKSEDADGLLTRYAMESSRERSPAVMAANSKSNIAASGANINNNNIPVSLINKGRPPISSSRKELTQGRTSVSRRTGVLESKSPSPRKHTSGSRSANYYFTESRGKSSRGQNVSRGRGKPQMSIHRSVSQSTNIRNIRGGSSSLHNTTAGNEESSITVKGKGITGSSLSHSLTHKGRKKSFIESITLYNENDPWQPNIGSGSKPRKSISNDNVGVNNDNNTPSSTHKSQVLKPLPHQISRKLYTEDLAKFEENKKDEITTSLISPFPPKLSVDALQPNENNLFGVISPSHPGSLSNNDGTSHNILTQSNVDGNNAPSFISGKMTIGNRSLHSWTEPPSNIQLPTGVIKKQNKQEQVLNQQSENIEGDIWRFESHLISDENQGSKWMESLQEIGRSKENSSLNSKEKKIGKKNSNSIDDYEYHSFLNISCHHDPHYRVNDYYSIENLNKNVKKVLGESNEFVHSMAACSAILREPQELLDSEFLLSSNNRNSSPLSTKQQKNNQWLNFFSSGKSRNPLFRTSPSSSQHQQQKELQYVEMSHPAKVLYAALLYLRTLGGFPTLLRISPLPVDCSVVGKEHCVQLVFSNNTTSPNDNGEKDEKNISSSSSSGLRLRYWSLTNATAGMEFLPWRNPSITGNSISNNNNINSSKERVVIVRSILAQKSVVERFGKCEIVHVLPPVQIPNSSTINRESRGSTRTLASRGAAVHKLLNEAESGLSSMGRFKNSYNSNNNNPLQQLQHKYKIDEKNIDYGDIAVTFLMSAGASELSEVLPEPMELEALRYKVFALRQQELSETPTTATTTTSKEGINNDNKISRRQRRRSTFEIELMKMTAESPQFPASPQAKNGGGGLQPTTPKDFEIMQKRFPLYRPVTVAESTLASMTNLNQNNKKENNEEEDDECVVPNFQQLRLPRLYEDIIGAVRYALEVQVRLANEKVMNARLF